MRALLKIITLLVFIGLNIQHASGQHYPNKDLQASVTFTVINFGPTVLKDKTTYYVRVGDTISKLVDKEGYIIAAKRLGMEKIKIIPDGKVYRTVSLDLAKDDEELKNAIEVKIDEIIIKD